MHRETEGEGKWWALLEPKGEGGKVEVCHAVLQGDVRRGRVVLQCAEMPRVISGNEGQVQNVVEEKWCVAVGAVLVSTV